MNTLVTGISGLLGANFALEARDQFEITGVYHQHRIAMAGVDCIAGDLRSREAVNALLARVRPRIIVHFAAATNVDWCEEHPEQAWSSNTEVARHLAEWSGRQGSLMVLMSTDSVFSGERGNYSEHDRPAPVNVYAATKLASENLVREMCGNHIIVRANLYGWNAQPKVSLGEWIVQRLEAGLEVPGFTDVVFTPMLANSLATCIVQLIRRRAHGTIHVASREPLSKYDFARKLATVFGYPAKLCVQTQSSVAGFRARRPLNTSLDAGYAASTLDLSMLTVEEDLQRFKAMRVNGQREELRSSYRLAPG